MTNREFVSVVRIINAKLKPLIASGVIRKQDRKDAVQDILTEVQERLKRHNSSISNLATFVWVIVDGHVAKIKRASQTEKHRTEIRIESLNAPVKSDDGEHIELIDIVSDELASKSRSDQELFELKNDVHTVIQKMPEELQDIAYRLMEKNIQAVSVELNIPRSTLYDRIQSIRLYFIEHGISDYL